MTFSFAHPWLLVLLLVVPVLVYLPRWRKSAVKIPAIRYGNTQLVIPQVRTWKLRARPALFALRLVALALIILAVARPQTGQAREIVSGEGVDIVLALDISGSMGSLDFEPQDRLGAAKEVISDFVDEREHDRIGLVVFANEAFVQSPPTVDRNVLQGLMAEVELAADLHIQDGTAIGSGLASAGNMLRESDVESKVVVLLTDGVNNAGPIDPITAAIALEALDIKVYTIGVGKPGRVPTRQRTRFGERIVMMESELDEDTLRLIAETTGGRFFRATDIEGLRDIYEEINSLETSEFEVQVFTRYQELAAWLLVPAVLILLLELVFRNTVLRTIP